MKLGQAFYRLPVRFDVARLRDEIAMLPPEAWANHPQEYEGNTAAHLISVGGTQNDLVGGEMRPTPALLASPYLQQVLASFGTVWSRSRLMRIAGGGHVPEHSDINYHWFYRVRVHIPIVTRPEVRFYCGGQQVHMAAGEAWIFDNWRQHKVDNPSAVARIHLVADTTGTSSFWQLVSQAQWQNFNERGTEARLIPFDSAAKPELLIERYNLAPLMSPSEVEQLAFDLLQDLAPVDGSQNSAAAMQSFIGAVVDFCRDWRSLWSLFDGNTAGRHQYQQLAEHLQTFVSELPPIGVRGASASAPAVLNARLLTQLFGGGRDRAREAAEFNRPSESPREAVRSSADESPAKQAFTGMLFEAAPAVVEHARTDSRPRMVFDRPVIVLSAPRAGSTLLYETLSQAADLYTIGGESHGVLEGIDELRPGSGVTSNRLTEAHATPEVIDRLRARFAAGLRNRDGLPPPAAASVRLLEKTPKNALRVPFLCRVFPDAKFLFLHRDPRASLSSMIDAWRSGGWVTYPTLAGWDGPWSMLLPPDYEHLRAKPLEEVVAFQWRVANATLLDDLSLLPRDAWTFVCYEDLVGSPRSEILRLLEFAQLRADDRLDIYLSRPLPLSRYTQTPPDPEKWRRNATEVERVMPLVAEVASRLGR